MTTRRLAAILTATVVFSLLQNPGVEAAPSRASLQTELNKISTEISILDEDFNEARINLAKVESQIRDAKSQKAEADTALNKLREKASARAAVVYKRGLPDILIVMLTSRSSHEFERKMGFVSKVSTWDSEVVTGLEIAGNMAERRSEDLQTDLKQARAFKASIAAKKSQLESRMVEQKKLLEQIAAAEAAAAAQAAARARAAAASRTRTAVPRRSVQPPPPEARNLPASGSARTAVQTAYDQIGKPYKWGASGPGSFDCSGLTMYSWGKAGVSLPHSSRAQYSATPRVAREDLQPGDLVFFGSPIHHVGIYVGDGNMINAPETGEYVGVRSMNRRDYVGAGRPGV